MNGGPPGQRLLAVSQKFLNGRIQSAPTSDAKDGLYACSASIAWRFLTEVSRRYGRWPRPRRFELRSALHPKRGPQTRPQGYAPTATRNRNKATPRETSRKGDIFKELRHCAIRTIAKPVLSVENE
jgi:hypothetical protein